MNVLSRFQLEQKAPSIFAVEPWEGVSQKYTMIPTISIVEGLMKEGFMPVRATQSRVRLEGRRSAAKHMIRFQREDMPSQMRQLGEVRPEIVLVNSHDGTSSYSLYLGLFRLVCSNGMTVKDASLDEVRVKHSGNILEQVIEASYRVARNFENIAPKIEQMQRIVMSIEDTIRFAEAARKLRFPDYGTDENLTNITAEDIIRPRRWADMQGENTLWNIFNRTQENLTKGKIRYRDASYNRRSTRAITGIDTDVALNRGLWALAETVRAERIGA